VVADLLNLKRPQYNPIPLKVRYFHAVVSEQVGNWLINSIAVGKYGLFNSNSSLKCVLHPQKIFLLQADSSSMEGPSLLFLQFLTKNFLFQDFCEKTVGQMMG